MIGCYFGVNKQTANHMTGSGLFILIMKLIDKRFCHCLIKSDWQNVLCEYFFIYGIMLSIHLTAQTHRVLQLSSILLLSCEAAFKVYSKCKREYSRGWRCKQLCVYTWRPNTIHTHQTDSHRDEIERTEVDEENLLSLEAHFSFSAHILAYYQHEPLHNI